MTAETILVVGGSGVVGRAVLEACTRERQARGWRVVGLSRRDPEIDGAEHVSLDLLDADACARAAERFDGVTHVVFAALFEKPGLVAGWLADDQMATNLALLRNLLTPLLARANSLKHVALLQGTKAYGAHIAPMSVPGKERAPRVEHPNFYWLQEDWLRARRPGAPWTFTIWRPPLILGHAPGAPMNILAAIGAFGTLERAARGDGAWPGGPVGPIDAVDADLLAAAIVWGFDADAARDETFNVTNGDVLVASSVWPRLMARFGLPSVAEAHRRSFVALCERSAEWRAVAEAHRLREPDLDRFVGDSLIYADLFFNTGGDVVPPSTLLSSIKLRQAGFHDCRDSEDVMVGWLARLQEGGWLPGAENLAAVR
ncbi:MAG: NAD-dependent epimerase/dehydratase family protein [Pseudomonadota bacterium]